MKNFILINLFLLTISVYAQDTSKGVKGGFNYATSDLNAPDLDIDNSYIPSFYGGFFAEFDLNKSEDKIELGLIYHRNGTDYGIDLESGIKETGIIYVNQINLPINYKKFVSENFFITGGAYLGTIIYADAQFEYDNTDFSDTIEITEDFRTFEIGLNVGAEYNFDFGGFVELKYNYGLTNVLKSDLDNFESDASFKNRFFLLGVGYRF